MKLTPEENDVVNYVTELIEPRFESGGESYFVGPSIDDTEALLAIIKRLLTPPPSHTGTDEARHCMACGPNFIGVCPHREPQSPMCPRECKECGVLISHREDYCVLHEPQSPAVAEFPFNEFKTWFNKSGDRFPRPTPLECALWGFEKMRKGER